MDLMAVVKHNEQMRSTMRDLLDKAEQMKLAIEQALAVELPVVTNWSGAGGSGGEFQGWSLSDSEGPSTRVERDSSV